MNIVPIVMTTYGRESEKEQITLSQIPDELLSSVFIFCRTSRIPLLVAAIPRIKDCVVELPDDFPMAIAAIRAEMVREFHRRGYKKIWMVDDRLKFANRMEDGSYKNTTKENFVDLWKKVSEVSKEYVMLHVATKKDGALLGDKVPKNLIKECGRAYANYVLDLDFLIENDINFDGMYRVNNDIKMMEDFYLSCKILSKGVPNAIYYGGGFDHKVGAAGGNSITRTPKMQEDCCREINKLFPRHTKLVEKESNWGDLDTSRVDMVIQWKKLYEDSIPASNTLEDFFS